ncbi:hypothetical protein SBRY_50549 [Actinacidiphila bryophytorum]|uniref:Uncharacterized protein n=1 Tax=Actinacidiphila bryophytorum TaxID=1436133 RepID=A0A9W4H4J1_9ACTN|nr:hypothetical protein SBRY_50549 [Actinacidiphila bryophytorum]
MPTLAGGYWPASSQATASPPPPTPVSPRFGCVQKVAMPKVDITSANPRRGVTQTVWPSTNTTEPAASPSSLAGTVRRQFWRRYWPRGCEVLRCACCSPVVIAVRAG